MRIKGLVGVTLLLAGPAFAADLDARGMAVKTMPVKALPAAPVYNWTGFYIGGNPGGVLNSLTSQALDLTDNRLLDTG